MMDLEHDLVHTMLSLLVDGASPMATFYPELRLELSPARQLSASQVVQLIEQMRHRGIITVRQLEPDGSWRPIDDDTYGRIVAEYGSGDRSADVVQQIFDRTDVWCEMTDQGRQEYDMKRK